MASLKAGQSRPALSFLLLTARRVDRFGGVVRLYGRGCRSPRAFISVAAVATRGLPHCHHPPDEIALFSVQVLMEGPPFSANRPPFVCDGV
jgi:hypothetical protein